MAALPFPAKLLSEYGRTTTSTACYSGAIALSIGLLWTMNLRLLTAPAPAGPEADPGRLRATVRRDLLLFLVFATAIPVAFWSPGLAEYWWLLAVPVRAVHRRPVAPAAVRRTPPRTT
ncbi:hypothetical protein [Streptomyces sp. NPDC059224]|uniref:hypothetical protein n=1 Tax=Streptomyces sp. NPDC059224 TaxID=3346775 RepID=UPI0036CBA1C4